MKKYTGKRLRLIDLAIENLIAQHDAAQYELRREYNIKTPVNNRADNPIGYAIHSELLNTSYDEKLSTLCAKRAAQLIVGNEIAAPGHTLTDETMRAGLANAGVRGKMVLNDINSPAILHKLHIELQRYGITLLDKYWFSQTLYAMNRVKDILTDSRDDGKNPAFAHYRKKYNAYRAILNQFPREMRRNITM